MKKLKLYTVETKKKSYNFVGSSIQDVKEYINKNKEYLYLTFDMSESFKVIYERDYKVNFSINDDSTPDITANNGHIRLYINYSTDEADYIMLNSEK